MMLAGRCYIKSALFNAVFLFGVPRCAVFFHHDGIRTQHIDGRDRGRPRAALRRG
jgi:hypothetical protein